MVLWSFLAKMQNVTYDSKLRLHIALSAPSLQSNMVREHHALVLLSSAGTGNAVVEDGWSQIQGNFGRKSDAVCKRPKPGVEDYLPTRFKDSRIFIVI